MPRRDQGLAIVAIEYHRVQIDPNRVADPGASHLDRAGNRIALEQFSGLIAMPSRRRQFGPVSQHVVGVGAFDTQPGPWLDTQNRAVRTEGVMKHR